MIAQVTDRLSRVMLSGGVLSGAYLLSFIPIRKGAYQYSQLLVKWVQHWTGSSITPFLPVD